ncbi:MAG: aminomethyl-transferring glycine dehydrogenase subunit GcvPA [Candidatus Thermoplasmatota archaeon]|nr:aminomethyl-transferring glycine dehydrogenase subunit GcvPA [Candidatus Thermoplasmatota archaeon]MBS3790811.1 aminomethyl-transferring glycine dehydrogenase subunit GcvPA [Candidatus Thermoplasmatota archaeon]
MSAEKEMLDFLGLDEKDELFQDIPDLIRTDLDIPKGVSEMEAMVEVKDKLEKNRDLNELTSFLGGGIYNHYVPAAVGEIIGKSEFYTSYTPYQAEISQGLLQALFEYQSLIAELTGLGAVNTSMYDYPTALAEAVLMAARISRKGNTFLLPENIHWEKDPVLENYLRGKDIEIEKVQFEESGKIDKEDLKSKLNEDVLGFYVETPNVFGVLEDDVEVFNDLKEDHDCVLVAGTDPMLLSLMRPPADWGADIVVGESQALGIPPSYGGPTVGIFASDEKYIRKMPGRIIGETEDSEGRRAYCMTLQTREQHIRRERATSNICTNQSLMALASAVYTYTKGGRGLEDLAKENYRKAHDLAERIDKIEGFEAPYFDSEFNKEFTVKTPEDSQKIFERCAKKDILPGIPLDKKRKFSSLPNMMLTAVTEMNTDEDIDSLVETLEEVVG